VHRFANLLELESQAGYQQLHDFEFARQELTAKQNARCVEFLAALCIVPTCKALCVYTVQHLLV